MGTPTAKMSQREVGGEINNIFKVMYREETIVQLSDEDIKKVAFVFPQ